MSNTYQLGQRKISRVVLLTNPAAGKGRAVAALEEATRAFYGYGVDVVRLSGSSPEASRELAREMIRDDSIDALVACGGDGLIGLALQEQAGTDTPLGIIPAGTGNDHAREYRIPLDPRRAAKVIVEGFTTRTDLGIMRTDDGRERYFGTIACAGFDSLVTTAPTAFRGPRANRATCWPFSSSSLISTRCPPGSRWTTPSRSRATSPCAPSATPGPTAAGCRCARTRITTTASLTSRWPPR